MIVRDPRLPDPFSVLERQESFGEYARACGDTIAQRYEDNRVVVIPWLPIAFDRAFIRDLVFPPEWKKIGTANGIDRPLFERRGGEIAFAADHPLSQRFGQTGVAIYAQEQIASFNAQLRRGLSQLFPRYYSLQEANITWRLNETVEEGMHFDLYRGGAPLPAEAKGLHRLKLFINLDDEPRRWRVSHDLPGALKAGRGKLPAELPDDVNVVCDLIDKFRVLEAQPAHKLDYPAMSAVLANGETVAHEVVYGRKVVGVEFVCLASDMLAPEKLSHRRLAGWLTDAGYRIAPDAGAVAAKHAQMQGSYALNLAKGGRARNA